MIAAVRPDLPTGTVTFLFTDVEGSTTLLHELGAETYAEALRAAGAQVPVTVYPNAGHGFDGGRRFFNAQGENYSQ